MIRGLQARIGETVDLGWVVADSDAAHHFWRAVGLSPPRTERELPLGLALALRGGPSPAVELAPDTVSVHAGHALSARNPFTGGRRYRVLTRIAEIFEKSGRSGPLTVIVRTAELCDETEAVVVSLREQQIARWRRALVAPPPDQRPSPVVGRHSVGPEDVMDIGSTIGVIQRRAPGAATVRAYASGLGGREPLFSDADFARRLGFADIIVPGPMQSTLFEGLLANSLPEWALTDLSLSFRISLVVDEPITLTALATEVAARSDRLVADLTLENSRGERATVGTATLIARRQRELA